MTKLSFDHLHLLTRDIEATVAFYRDVLGAEVVGREQRDRARAHLSLGGMRIFITDMSGEPAVAAGAPHPHLGLDHIAFQVEGLDEVCAALIAAAFLFVGGCRRAAIFRASSPRPRQAARCRHPSRR